MGSGSPFGPGGSPGGGPKQPSPFSGMNAPKPENRPPAVPPPPAKVDIRTFASDVTSIGRGDAMPIPESVMAPEGEKELLMGPDTENQLPGGSVSEGGGKKKAVLWVSSILGVIVLGLVGYFVVYPLLFPPAPPEPPPAPPAPPAPALIHQSYFSTAADATARVVLANVSLFSISDELATVAGAGLEAGKLQEVVVADSGDSQVPASSYLGAFGLGISAADLATWFEDDFTAFMYYDANGEWPGYVLKLKAGVTADAAKAGLAALESADLSALYLDPVGAASGAFRDGQVNGKAARYVAFPDRAGAAFSYTVADEYAILSTNYDGAKKAATLLGF